MIALVFVDALDLVVLLDFLWFVHTQVAPNFF